MPAPHLVRSSACTPITPVDATSTWSASQPSARGRRVGHLARVAQPGVAGARVGAAAVDDDGPARGRRTRARCSRDTTTGAACALLVVNTAAADTGASAAISARSSGGRGRPALLDAARARPRRGSRAGAVTPPSTSGVIMHGHVSAAHAAPRPARRARRTLAQRQHHRVLLAAAEQRAAQAVGRDLLRQPQVRHDREALADEEPRVVREGAERVEPAAPRAPSQLGRRARWPRPTLPRRRGRRRATAPRRPRRRAAPARRRPTIAPSTSHDDEAVARAGGARRACAAADGPRSRCAVMSA